jgi:hypothetical protein
MKNLIKIFSLLFFSLNIQGQTNKQQFEFDSSQIEYLFIPSKHISNKFYIVITKNENQFSDLEKRVSKCVAKKKNIGNIYILVIPNNLLSEKEKVVLDFMNDILSKKKLIDKQMNLIVDENYFALYEDIRIKNKGKYKTCFLNKIHKTTILKTTDNICKTLN